MDESQGNEITLVGFQAPLSGAMSFVSGSILLGSAAAVLLPAAGVAALASIHFWFMVTCGIGMMEFGRCLFKSSVDSLQHNIARSLGGGADITPGYINNIGAVLLCTGLVVAAAAAGAYFCAFAPELLAAYFLCTFLVTFQIPYSIGVDFFKKLNVDESKRSGFSLHLMLACLGGWCELAATSLVAVSVIACMFNSAIVSAGMSAVLSGIGLGVVVASPVGALVVSLLLLAAVHQVSYSWVAGGLISKLQNYRRLKDIESVNQVNSGTQTALTATPVLEGQNRCVGASAGELPIANIVQK